MELEPEKDTIKPGPIKGAKVVQTMPLNEWQIWTGIYQDKGGWISARHRYPIPKKTIKQIAYDFLINNVGGAEKGIEFELFDRPKNGKREKFTVMIKRSGFEDEPVSLEAPNESQEVV